MSELGSFVIDFYVTCTNGSAVSTIITQPVIPTKTSVTTSIENLISYIQANGINFSNYSMINDGVNSLPYSSSTTSSEEDTSGYGEIMNKIKSSLSSKESLIKNLQELLEKVKTDSDSIDITTPDMEIPSGSSPSVVGNLKARRTGGKSDVSKFQGLGSKFSGLQSDSSNLYTGLSKFVGAVKAAVNSLNSEVSGTGSGSAAVSTTSGQSSQQSSGGSSLTDVFNTSGTVSGQSSGTPNNIINNIAKTIMGGRVPGVNSKTGRKKPNKTTTKNNTSISSLNSYKAPVPTTVPNTTGTAQTTDYYEISTSISGGYINVLYSYYPANSTTSSYAFTFSISSRSLISLSLCAYLKSTHSSQTVKTSIIDHSGYTGSTDNLGIWCSYLIWLYSYLGTGVASQLGLNTIIAFPEEELGSVNYMMDFDYMQKVGNFSLSLQKSTMDSDDGALLDVSIPYVWPNMMYSFDHTKKYACQENYMANAVVKTIKSNTETV